MICRLLDDLNDKVVRLIKTWFGFKHEILIIYENFNYFVFLHIHNTYSQRLQSRSYRSNCICFTISTKYICKHSLILRITFIDLTALGKGGGGGGKKGLKTLQPALVCYFFRFVCQGFMCITTYAVLDEQSHRASWLLKTNGTSSCFQTEAARTLEM